MISISMCVIKQKQRRTPAQILKQKVDRTVSLLSQSRSGKLRVSAACPAPTSYELGVSRRSAPN